MPLGKSQMLKKKRISHNYEIAKNSSCLSRSFSQEKSNDKNKLYTIFLMIYMSTFFMLINCYANELLYYYPQCATHGTYYLVIDFECYGNCFSLIIK